MEAGLRIGWGKVLPEKATEALGLFQDVVTYYGKKMADGKITYFEPFFMATGEVTADAGFFIVKGQLADIFGILEDTEYKELNSRAYFFLDHFKVDLLVVGDEIQEQLKRFEKLAVA